MAAAHPTSLELTEPAPSDVPVGSDITFKLRVTCAAGCDLHGMALAVAAADGAPVKSAAAPCVGEGEEAISLTVKAPPRPGDHAWMISVAAHEHGGVVHQAATLPVHVTTIPQTTSLAVW